MERVTLEELKDKQLALNNLLSLNIKDLQNILDSLVGEEELKVSDSDSITTPIDKGIVNELYSAQKELENKLNKLEQLKQRLYNALFNNIKVGNGIIENLMKNH